MEELNVLKDNADLLKIDIYPYMINDDPTLEVSKEIVIDEDMCQSFLSLPYSEKRRRIYHLLRKIQNNNLHINRWNNSTYFLLGRLYADRAFFDLPQKQDNFLVRVKFSNSPHAYIVIYHKHTYSDVEHLQALKLLMKYGVMLPELMSDFYIPKKVKKTEGAQCE